MLLAQLLEPGGQIGWREPVERTRIWIDALHPELCDGGVLAADAPGGRVGGPHHSGARRG
jgi:hypothetical protein